MNKFPQYGNALLLLVVAILLMVVVTAVLLSFGSSDPSDYVVPEDLMPTDPEYYQSDEEPEEKPSGVFYCSIKNRDDVFQANIFRLEVKTHPADGEWPGSKVDDMTGVKEVIQTIPIRIRGVDAPGMHESNQPDWKEHHVRIARHRARHAEGSAFAWDVLNRFEIKWLTNVDKKIFHLGPGNLRYVVCDMYIEMGGSTVSFADLLMDEGHALPASIEQRWDWGMRFPKLKIGGIN